MRITVTSRGTFAIGLALALLATTPFAARPTKKKPAKGMFLVASPRMMDPNFSRTVILLTTYSPDGAMGLVVNRSTNVSIAQALPEFSRFPGSSEAVFFGGPVTPNGLFMLVRTGVKLDRTQQILDDVYLGRNQVLLKELIDDPDSDRVYRVYAGYAGWRPGQLEVELARGDWIIRRADADSLFAENGQLWRNLLPPDPSWSAELRPNHP